MTTADPTAAYLAALRLEMRKVDELPAEFMPADLTSAYRSQAALVAMLCEANGAYPVGYKVAVTNPAAQAMLGVSHPIYGRLLSKSIFDSGATISAALFTTRLIECELGFRITRDVPASTKPYDRDSIAEYAGQLIPAFEIVDHRFAAIDRVTPESLAADNAIHGAWVQGRPISDWRRLDLAAVATSLHVNGKRFTSGSGSAVLGHPLNVLAWLANTLPEHGLQLSAGDYVTTGVTTPEIYDAQPGDHVAGDFGALGRVELYVVD